MSSPFEILHSDAKMNELLRLTLENFDTNLMKSLDDKDEWVSFKKANNWKQLSKEAKIDLITINNRWCVSYAMFLFMQLYHEIAEDPALGKN